MIRYPVDDDLEPQVMSGRNQIVCICQGAEGLINNNVREFSWMDVEECVSSGGSMLQANRKIIEVAKQAGK